MAQLGTTGVELIVRGASDFFGTLDAANDRIVGFGKTAAKAAAAGAVAFGAAVAGIGVASLKTAIDFESAFAGVIKTTDGLVDEFGNLTEAGAAMQLEFRALAKEVPTAVEELLAIGELGGQLGIAKEDLIDFTRTIAAMGEATNLSTEEAATSFAQLANIMGTPSEEIENMGSAVVALGNNFATTERDVVNFASRIAGAGQVAGLTEAQVFGISAAFSSVGIQAQAGGTATSKALLAMNKAALEGGEQMEIFAAVAGLSADEFGSAWEEDAGAVFAQFVQGLGIAGDDAINILDALNIKDSQATRAFLSLAGAGDLVTDAMNLSSEAFEENTALAAEAAQRYATTESKIAILKNTIKDVAITIGQALLPAFNKVLDFGIKLAEGLGARLPGLLNNFLVPAIRNIGKWLGIFADFISFTIKSGDALNDTLMDFPARARPIILFIGTIVGALSDLTKSILIAIGNLRGGSFGLKDVSRSAVDFGITLTILGFKARDIFNKVKAFIVKNGDVIRATLRNIGAAFAVAFAARKVVGRIKLIMMAVTALANPLVLIAGAIALFLVAWENNWFGIREKTQAVIDALTPIFQTIQQWLAVFIPQAVQFLTDLWNNTLLPALTVVWGFVQDNLIPAFMQFVQFLQGVMAVVIEEVSTFAQEQFAQIVAWVDENWPRMQETIDTVLTAIQLAVETALTFIQEFWQQHGEQLLSTIEPVWDTIKAIVEAAIQIVQQIIEAVMSAIAGDWDAVWQNIANIAATLWELIKTTVANALEVLKNIIPAALTLIKGLVAAALIVLVRLFKTGWDFITKGIQLAWESIEMIIDSTQTLIKALINRGLRELKNIFIFIWDSIVAIITTAWEGIVSFVQGGIDTVVGILRGVVGTMGEVGRAIVDAVRQGIENAWDGLVNWFKDRIGDLTSLLPFSEPKDPTSPMRNLAGRGKAIVGNILTGLQDAMPALQTALTAAITVPQVITAPASVGANPVANTTFNLTQNNTINSGMDAEVFNQRTLNTVTQAIGLE